MKRLIMGWLLLSALILSVGPIQAQDGGGRQRIESNKIAYITNRLNLTPDQAPQFWAVYNQYSAQKQELNRKVRQLTNRSVQQGLAEQDVLSNLRESNATKQKIADLDQEYMPRFLKIISPAQLAELQNAERSFNKILLDRLNKN
jgi:Spy/CpxP family protein refolding chaperone